MTQIYWYETILTHTEATPRPLSSVQVYSDSSGLVVSKSGAVPQLRIKIHQYTRTLKLFCILFAYKNLFFLSLLNKRFWHCFTVSIPTN